MDYLIPVLGIISLFVLPAVGVVFICYLIFTGRHRERMAMIERGIVPQEEVRKANPNRFIALRNGILMASMAVGALLGIAIDSNLTLETEWSWLFVPTMIVLLGGVGFVGYFFLSRGMEEKAHDEESHLPLND